MTTKSQGKRIGSRMVPLDHLRAHPLNSNVMPETCGRSSGSTSVGPAATLT